MTNTLHRRGSPEELEHDFVVKCFPPGKQEAVAEKIAAFRRIAASHGPISHILPDGSVREVNEFVFDNPAAVKEVLAELKAADLGISIVVSGLIERVDNCCREAGLSLHTIEHSLGVLGRTERLPSTEILDIASLCGHGMISHNLIEKMAGLVKLGRLTPRQASIYLAKPCTCGSFNRARAESILKRLKLRG
jgi:hypothetical protein